MDDNDQNHYKSVVGITFIEHLLINNFHLEETRANFDDPIFLINNFETAIS